MSIISTIQKEASKITGGLKGVLNSFTLINPKTGEHLGAVQNIESNMNIDTTNQSEWKFNRSVTAELKDAQINYDALSKILGQDKQFKIVVISKELNRLKFLHKRTKNRRIKKKLQKRIEKLDHPILNVGATVSGRNIHSRKNGLVLSNVQY